MEQFEFTEHSHRRYNALTGDWVLVSPHRTKRPWQGKVEKPAIDERPQYDEKCYLCPGNERAGGHKNPDYKDVFVFQNDFSALVPDIPEGNYTNGDLFRAESERGFCKVICFSPRHDLTIPEMEVENIKKVVDLWCEQYEEIGTLDYIKHVQIFENKGDIMGCSNPHPHGQIWGQYSVPVEPAKEAIKQKEYFDKHGKTLLEDYVADELKSDERILVENDHFVALVPFWATWPFEAMIVSKRAVSNLTQLTEAERTALADAYKKLTVMYDNLFEVSFPYSAGIHQAPTDGEDHPEWHLHMHFYPPLLRSATVKKFMVGYEMMANAQRDITAEQAAQRLRDLPTTHYKAK
ncbi:UDP-glucose--hexose-1-phosphate uridylyltransferase [Carboxylicivirga sp. A043]|uniref:UDP-glucose--hexose-1-phosphate uridylyltransferase n=1 Tax=Carboxylicivirga litoralis TaxID=2816963 RepID=UPI0021CAEBC1|nr:UDP-glucose--hexose-1-phosphate uridylyltransferase [Carboxylicivirga sp. A043]MCU4155659.1 UDP-glucose--hexose-1-phosphate uridylyltransferase [Carboxylicivirga sp. A043]